MGTIRCCSKTGNIIQSWIEATKNSFFTDIKHIEGNRFLVVYRTGTTEPRATVIYLVELDVTTTTIYYIQQIYNLGNTNSACGVTITPDGNHILALLNVTTPSEADTLLEIDWNGSLVSSTSITAIATGAAYIDMNQESIFLSGSSTDIYVLDSGNFSLKATIVYGAGRCGIHLEDEYIWRMYYNSVSGTNNVEQTDYAANQCSFGQFEGSSLVGWNGITGCDDWLYVCK
jgi:hypothetical protein